MRNQPLVSVIIPVYNVEKYLDACLLSVAEQTYQNLEIILIDDGSTDGSGKKCDAWAKKDNRFKVVHKKNEGLNYARRDGFKKSSGDYITFLDSDDLIHRDCIEIFMKALLENAADAVVCASREFSDTTERIEALLRGEEELLEVKILDSKEKIIRYAVLGEPGFPDANYMTAWGKMFSRRLLEGINWHESNFRSYEDNFWTPQVLVGADKVALVANQLHFYRRNIKYGSEGATLGNRLTGNTHDNRPVGFIEYLDLLHGFYGKLTAEHDVNIASELEELYYRQSWSRLSVLIEAGLIDKENNLKYLKDIWKAHLQKDWALEHKNAEQEQQILDCKDKIQYLENELAGYDGIKHTARQLKKNIQKRLDRK